MFKCISNWGNSYSFAESVIYGIVVEFIKKEDKRIDFFEGYEYDLSGLSASDIYVEYVDFRDSPYESDECIQIEFELYLTERVYYSGAIGDKGIEGEDDVRLDDNGYMYLYLSDEGEIVGSEGEIDNYDLSLVEDIWQKEF